MYVTKNFMTIPILFSALTNTLFRGLFDIYGEQMKENYYKGKEWPSRTCLKSITASIFHIFCMQT